MHSTSCLLPYFHLTTVVYAILHASPEEEIYRLMSSERTGHSAVLPCLTTFRGNVSSMLCKVACQNVEAGS